jgi:hypothetical protein
MKTNFEEKFTKCSCGSSTFWVTEELLWKGFIDPETGELDCHNKDSEVKVISCVECGKDKQDFYYDKINFN